MCAELTWSRKTAATALANAEEKLPKYWEHLAETGATRVGALGTAEQRLHFAVYPKRAASPPPPLLRCPLCVEGVTPEPQKSDFWTIRARPADATACEYNRVIRNQCHNRNQNPPANCPALP